MLLKPPTTYQGGKQRLAPKIIDIIQPEGDFYDVCCGSGAITLELLNRGYNPAHITMIDSGMWGKFWQSIADRQFDLHTFEDWLDKIPKDKREIKPFLENLSKTQPNNAESVYIYLLLQAGSFGGKAVWLSDKGWQNCSFRNYWMPTENSRRRSPVNPMMPMPDTLLKRVELILNKSKGIKAFHVKAEDFPFGEGVVYIDPPYQDLTDYGANTMDLTFAQSLNAYISESYPMTDSAIILSNGRTKGGISGNRGNANQEWLNLPTK